MGFYKNRLQAYWSLREGLIYIKGGLMKKNFSFQSSDGKKIPVSSYKVPSAQAVLQIVHGMAEHRERYHDFALFLNKNKINVYIQDLRGHGENINRGDTAGFFRSENGWQACLDDIHIFAQLIKKENSRLPFFIFGHSMGSFLTRNYLHLYASMAQGFIFSGTAASLGMTGKFMIWKAKQEIKKQGDEQPSFFLSNTMNKSLNRKFASVANTGFEWLSNDVTQVQKYLDDPLCGFASTANLFLNMAQGNLFVNKTKTIQSYPKDIPLLLLSGAADPVGGKKAIHKIFRQMKKAGLKNVSTLLYEGGRHEMLNELNNQEVYHDILSWLQDQRKKI